MNRREFLLQASLAPVVVGAAVQPKPKPIIRLPVDADLSATSFRWAASLGGFVDPPAHYVLRVHPQLAPWAERVLREEFGTDWRAHLILDDRLTDIDGWYLECSSAVVYSAGA